MRRRGAPYPSTPATPPARPFRNVIPGAGRDPRKSRDRDVSAFPNALGTGGLPRFEVCVPSRQKRLLKLAWVPTFVGMTVLAAGPRKL